MNYPKLALANLSELKSSLKCLHLYIFQRKRANIKLAVIEATLSGIPNSTKSIIYINLSEKRACLQFYEYLNLLIQLRNTRTVHSVIAFFSAQQLMYFIAEVCWLINLAEIINLYKNLFFELNKTSDLEMNLLLA